LFSDILLAQVRWLDPDAVTRDSRRLHAVNTASEERIAAAVWCQVSNDV
jgi:hypothetical protein